jgi:hypothetical protein
MGGSSNGSGVGFSGDGPTVFRFQRVDIYHPESQASIEVFPHGSLTIAPLDYVAGAAKRLGLERQYNWEHVAEPAVAPRILSADPWNPREDRWPRGHYRNATGQTIWWAQCWKYAPQRGFFARLFEADPSEPLRCHLAVSAVTWRFFETGDCSTSFVARLYHLVGCKPRHETLMLGVAKKLAADVKTWLEATPPSAAALRLRDALEKSR